MEKRTVGVLGCGRIAAVYTHALLALSDRVTVTVAADKDLERAKAFAANFPGCVAVQSVDELIAHRPQAVHILTPHFLHKEHAIACMEAGIDVLTEKPIAITLPDADAMIETAHRTGRRFGVIFQNRYIEGIVEAKRMLEAGELGRVTGAWSTLNWWRPESYYQCDWKGSWEKEGGGVVIDQAIHSIDLVRYLVGSPVTSINGHIDRRVLTTIEVEDVADAAITFENGVVYSFYACNYYTSNSDIRVELSCEKGSILLKGSVVTITMDGNERVIAPQQTDNGGERYWGNYHYCQLKDFYDSLDDGRPVPTDPADAKSTLAVVLGIYRSSKEGKAITL